MRHVVYKHSDIIGNPDWIRQHPNNPIHPGYCLVSHATYHGTRLKKDGMYESYSYCEEYAQTVLSPYENLHELIKLQWINKLIDHRDAVVYRNILGTLARPYTAKHYNAATN